MIDARETTEIERLRALLAEAERKAGEASSGSKRRRRPKRKEVEATFTDADVAELERRPKPYVHPDPDLPQHFIRVRSKGPLTFTVVCRDPYKVQRWVKVGNTGAMTIEQARERAREIIGRIKAGDDAIPKPPVRPESVKEICNDWLEREVGRKKFRTGAEMKRHVDRYILPQWAERPFADIKRSDITRMLDSVEDRSGPFMADAVLTTFRSVAIWHAKRDDSYVLPFVPKMARVPGAERKRKRKFEDAEIRAIWKAADNHPGAWGVLVKLLMLTGQRRAKIVGMRWRDVDAAGVWTMPTEPREKANPGKIQLPDTALAIVRAMPRMAGNAFVFAGNKGQRRFAFAREKEAFDKTCAVEGWRLHDLRHCAKSLMARAGVRPDVSERALGHTIGGVQGLYDQPDYGDEIADALARLAALIETIVVNPPTDNVVAMRKKRRRPS
jgi:integrase